MKQLATIWLADEIIELEEKIRLKKIDINNFIDKKDLLIELAIDMEKNNLIDFVINYLIFGKYGTKQMNIEELKIDIEDYYNKTFKSE